VSVPEWVANMYREVDAGNLDGYIDDFADDARLRFGSGPVIEGKSAVREALAAGHRAHGMRHKILAAWEVGDTTIVEFDAEWIMPEAEIRAFPAVTIYERSADGLVTSMRVYLDPPE
jgi:hypothetical protein